MKRFALLLTLILGLHTLSSAQEIDKHNFEGGVSITSYTTLFAHVDGLGAHYDGNGLYFEYRYNVTDYIDFGGKLYYQYSTGLSAPTGTPISKITYNQIGIKGFADLNILPGKKVCPYVGVSIGGTNNITNGRNRFLGTISPRIGVEVWRIRAAIELDYLYEPNYGIKHKKHLSLNIGFVF